LQVNQTVRFRLHKLPRNTEQVIAVVDPNQEVVEISEKNNDLSLKIAKKLPEIMPAPLDDVDVWVVPKAMDDEAADGPANSESQD
ncbi:MAG: hypothetical protein ACR2NM_08600, partial [Bythopirellula sp.]